MAKKHPSPLSNTLPGALLELLFEMFGDWLIDKARWTGAFAVGIVAIVWFVAMSVVTAMWLIVAGVRDE